MTSNNYNGNTKINVKLYFLYYLASACDNKFHIWYIV